KILVELDSSQLTEQLNTENIQYANAEASYTDAQESYNIQEKQNESDVSAGSLNVKFALMDLQKYLGQEVADQFVAATNQASGQDLNLSKIWEDPNRPGIGGEALQKWRDMQAAIELSDERLERAKDTLDWTQKLYEKKYVARTEMEADKLALRQREIEKEQAQTAMFLFKRYEFPKQVEQLWSDYVESHRELDRIEAKARSMLSQANAKLASSKAQFDLQKKQKEKLEKQIAACVIRAPTVGLVVYGTSGDFFRRRSEPIDAGVEVYERQKILTIPNTSEMMVETKVHETSVDKVRPGQRARITMEALPDKRFTGQVLKVSPLPDAQRGFLNPDLKVYNTNVSIAGSELSLLPGMSAKVEIIIEQFHDVLYIPVQAVVNRQGKKYCYAVTSGGLEEREIQTGSFNENFIVVYDGIQEGEKISLHPPRVVVGLEQQRSEPAAPDAGPEGAPPAAGNPPTGQGPDRPAGSLSQPQTEGQDRRLGPGQDAPGQAAQERSERRPPMGFDPEVMRKLQDPEVQQKIKKAIEDGTLAEELKKLGIDLPEEMIQRMQQGAGQGRPGGRSGNRSGGPGGRSGGTDVPRDRSDRQDRSGGGARPTPGN
ncbi:MAG: efflux RND transporter periplasmic adaptor subunit, partial [Sedimentisphaerales bacterium]|nr:efflux RND transporter periplasmic adaptor subunit [Sedimentisphaerales bacterium]